jgi:hypothetical protein
MPKAHANPRPGVHDIDSFGIGHWALGIGHLAFGIWHLAFGIWHLAFGILAFGIRH